MRFLMNATGEGYPSRRSWQDGTPRQLSCRAAYRFTVNHRKTPAMNGFLYVALGGAIGASLRHGAGLATMRMGLSGWPWATFFVNLLGSLLIGLLAGFLAFRGEALGGGQGMRLFLVTGVLGGFTTFSAFSLEVARYVEEDQWAKAATYAGLSVVAGLALVLIGMMIMRKVFA